ncbi:MAG: hypothetical protein H0W96_02505 [Solirubrobacterales bacterium]|nr:hypothetical protein [Solirubrobacterales bacterium]
MVEVFVDGAGLHVEPPAAESLIERGDLLVIPASGTAIGHDLGRELRDGDQR